MPVEAPMSTSGGPGRTRPSAHASAISCEIKPVVQVQSCKSCPQSMLAAVFVPLATLLAPAPRHLHPRRRHGEDVEPDGRPEQRKYGNGCAVQHGEPDVRRQGGGRGAQALLPHEQLRAAGALRHQLVHVGLE